MCGGRGEEHRSQEAGRSGTTYVVRWTGPGDGKNRRDGRRQQEGEEELYARLGDAQFLEELPQSRSARSSGVSQRAVWGLWSAMDARVESRSVSRAPEAPGGGGGGQVAATPFRVGHLTRPYQTLLVQIFCSRTTSPVFGECQIFPFPA